MTIIPQRRSSWWHLRRTLQTSPASQKRPAWLLVLVGLLAATAFAYIPGLQGWFAFDDSTNLLENTALKTAPPSWQGAWQAMWSGNAGPLGRPLAMLSFWGNFITTGMDPFWFKLTNLVVHGVNGLLVYGLVRELAAGRGQAHAGRLALLAAGLFLLHPLQLTSVLYVVQRMTSLSATFVLLGLWWYVRLRSRWQLHHGKGVALQAMAVLGLSATLAALTKENGVLIIPFALVLDMTLLQDRADRRLWLVYGPLLVLPGLWMLSYLLHHGQAMVQGYAIRGVALWPHWLSEARVLWLYLGLVFWPSQSAMGLYHDDFVPSLDLFHPPATIVALASWVVMLAGAGLLRRRMPWFSCAVLWFVVGHSMEALLNLELVHEHRNYLPILGPIMGAAALLAALNKTKGKLGLGAGLAALVLLSGLTLATAERATIWQNPVLWGFAEAAAHPRSGRAHQQAANGSIFMALRLRHTGNEAEAKKFLKVALSHLKQARVLDQRTIAADFTMLQVLGMEGHQPPPEDLQALQQRLRTGPVHISLSSAFEKLVEWQQKDITHLSHEDVAKLFQAAIDNPHTPRDILGMIHAYFALYSGNVAKDATNALQQALAATRADPGAYQHQFSLASLALQLGDTALARQALQRAAQLDPMHRGVARRRELLDALAALEEARQRQPAHRKPS